MKHKSVDDHFKPVQDLLTWAGYAMFAAAGLFIVSLLLLWSWYNLRTVLTMTAVAILWIAYCWWRSE